MQRPLTRWDNRIETGLLWQDFQHRQLLDLLYDLVGALGDATRRQHLDDALKFLDAYHEAHFGIEEAYMQASAYPATAAHKRAHEHFRRLALGIRQDLDRRHDDTGLTETTRLIVELNNWFVEHIGTIDRELARHLHAKGLG